MSKLSHLLLRLVAVAAFAMPVAASAAATLKVCVDADNPPFSSEQGGIDIDLARALAKQMQRDLVLSPVRVPERGGLGKALKNSIQAGQCDLFMGLPAEAEMQRELAERKLEVSQPYLVVGYVAVVPAAGRRGSRIGAVTATPADLWLHRNRNAERMPFGSNRELVEALRAGQLRSALIWSPALAEVMARNKDAGLRVDAEQPQDAGLRFGLVVAVRSDGVALAELDRAIGELKAAGRLAAIAADHALPSF